MIITKWDDWDLHMHISPDQVRRWDGRQNGVNPNTFKGRIDRANLSGITEEGYKTTLISCTCEDFQSRSLPCGHIYRLARELKVLQTPNIKRSLELLATFKNSFAEGWAFGVGEFHRDYLDIKYTSYKGNGQTYKTWTRGAEYQFDVGVMFYNNNPEIYRKDIWANVGKHATIALQVHSSTNNRWTYLPSYIPTTTETILRIESKYTYGSICFDVFTYDNCKAIKLTQYYAHADEFLKLLKYGHCFGIKDQEQIFIDLRNYLK